MSFDSRQPRRNFIIGGTAASALAFGPDPGLTAPLKPEKTKLAIGLATEAVSFMPFYVAAAQIWKSQGLDVQLLGFRGDAEAAQALAGGTVDISIQSLDLLLSLINSNQPVMGFYAGVYMADYAWLAQPSIKSWQDLKGKAMGISTFASQGTLLTQYLLKRHGLEPLKDVQFLQVGPPGAGAYQALRANRIAATMLSPPTKWMAADAGYNTIATQARDISPQWPKLVFIASKRFLTENPETTKAILRSYVLALRYAKANPAAVVDILQDRLKFEKDVLRRTLDEFLPSYNERGNLPQDRYMQIYWKFQIQSGTVTEPWPTSKFLDDRFINNFRSWAP